MGVRSSRGGRSDLQREEMKTWRAVEGGRGTTSKLQSQLASMARPKKTPKHHLSVRRGDLFDIAS